MNPPLALYEVDLQTQDGHRFFHLLSNEEQTFAQSIRNESLKSRNISVRVALRQILGHFLKTPPETLNILKAQHGKPYLADCPDVQFNISHSGSTLLVAISRIGIVGIDIEQAKLEKRNFAGLVKKCFALSEQQQWAVLSEQEKIPKFYQFWTRKEAFVKAVGRGLALDLQACVIADAQPPYFVKVPESCGLPNDWQLFDLSLKNGLYGALVVKMERLPKNFSLPKPTVFQLNPAE